MAGFAPKFCPTHLQIHVCELQNVFNKNKTIEDDLGAKVRRLHGTQTEEELAQQESKRKHQPGTLGDILAKARQKIDQEKETIAQNDPDNKVASGEEINDRMAALRAKMMGGSTPSPSNDQQFKQQESTGLQKVIQNAQEHQKENPQEVFKAPERSTMGENKYKDLPRGNKPSAVLKDLDLDLITADDVVGEPTSKKEDKLKLKKTKEERKENAEKLFSQEETQELIQLAVKEALKQVGIIGENEKPKKTTTKAKSKNVTTSSKRAKSEDEDNQKISEEKKPKIKKEEI
ncbi:hypothetical protein [Spiroplasma monobiae]|uniref:Uncharacterized protein n=1 Tax=Spiroplasma monobiae MQ-1 TaxID=1336748 RepID=A0A2K9LUF2_SPISQ|nr:hypothetical protein [Spiroplasma monobiae]AUM62683.1 hypothetical protein SMONO_v1c04340 [Spiroplasma monobiae MQ-1]